MGIDSERFQVIDPAGNRIGSAQDIIRTAEMAESYAVDVTELRMFLDQLGIFGPEQCTRFWHVHDARTVHYVDPRCDGELIGYEPVYTLCRMDRRDSSGEVRGCQEECTDATLHLPHCVWCVIRAGDF